MLYHEVNSFPRKLFMYLKSPVAMFKVIQTSAETEIAKVSRMEVLWTFEWNRNASWKSISSHEKRQL